MSADVGLLLGGPRGAFRPLHIFGSRSRPCGDDGVDLAPLAIRRVSCRLRRWVLSRGWTCTTSQSTMVERHDIYRVGNGMSRRHRTIGFNDGRMHIGDIGSRRGEANGRPDNLDWCFDSCPEEGLAEDGGGNFLCAMRVCWTLCYQLVIGWLGEASDFR
jgi:hypothetical protein